MKDRIKPRRMTRRRFLKLTASAAAGLSCSFPLASGASDLIKDALSVPEVVPIPAGEIEQYYDGLSLYWGELHGHSGFSDGYGLPEEYFLRAKDKKQLDFCALSDHAEWMVTFQESFPRQNPGSATLWERSINILDNACRPGEFVTLPSFEWTSDKYGHRNVYFRDTGHLPENPMSCIVFVTPDDLWAELDKGGYAALTIPHHPARDTAALDWSLSHARERLVEIYSKWGNAESYYSDYEPYARFLKLPETKLSAINHFCAGAFRRGHRLGIVAGTDTHQGLPGATMRNKPRGESLKEKFGVKGDRPLLERLIETGLTLDQFVALQGLGYTWDHREPTGAGGGVSALWASHLTRETVWDALWDRTTYGTSGIRPRIQFVLRDAARAECFSHMGGELLTEGKPEILVNIVSDSANLISKIWVSRNGIPLVILSGSRTKARLKFVDKDFQEGEEASFYTLKVAFQQAEENNVDRDRVLLFDGQEFNFGGPQLREMAWISPIWVNGGGFA